MRLLVGIVVAGLLPATAPVLAQDASPLDAVAMPSASADVDIFELVPETIGGLPPETSVVRGSEHFDGLDPEDDLDAQQMASLQEFVASLGAGIDDLTSISAVVLDGQSLSLLAGIQVAGAEPEALLTSYIETLIAEMGDPYQELGEIGGKTATLIIDESFEDELPLYVYGSGPMVWLIVADEAVVEELLSQLP